MTDTFVVSYKLKNRNRSQQAPLEESQIVYSTPIIDKLLKDWFFSRQWYFLNEYLKSRVAVEPFY